MVKLTLDLLGTNEKEHALRLVWGDEVIDEYVNWLFEYGCQEADYLQLRHKAGDDFAQARAGLCLVRRVEGINAYYVMTKDLHEQSKLDYKDLHKMFTMKVKPFRCIQGLIHRRYFPPEDADKAIDRIERKAKNRKV